MHDAPEDGKSQHSLPNTRITVNKKATFRWLVDQYLSLIGPSNKINGISHYQISSIIDEYNWCHGHLGNIYLRQRANFYPKISPHFNLNYL